jgi:formate hydrogenlyase subunit 5
VTRTRSTVEDGPAPRDGERALAYRAADASFELWNDYRVGAAIVRRAPAGSAGAPAAVPLARAGPRALAEPADVDGYGVFTFPYGPVSMGVPESGRFDLRTYGERILDLRPIGGYKSRRISTSIVGAPVHDAALRVERLAGPLSASHVAAFLAAAESAEGTAVPDEELWTRGLAQELQRIYNHVHVVARVGEAASQNVGQAQAHALAEELLRLSGSIFGHRWMFGALLPGGPRRRLAATDRKSTLTALHGLSDEFDALWELFLDSRTFIDRIQTTATVSRDAAIRLGAVGPVLRACGVDWDDRLRVPTPPYHDLFVALPHESGGDALGRLLVRAAEVRASFLLLEQLLDRWPGPGTTVAPPEPIAPGRGIGRVEGPSGDLVWDVSVTDGRVVAADYRSPSDANWPLFALGMRDAVFTDFHFAFESFGLSFAETDG